MKRLTDKLARYKTSDPASSNAEDILVRRYMDNNSTKTPKTEAINYIGIEIECFGKISQINLQKMFLHADLEEFVHIGRDGSIRPPEDEVYNTFELRLLIPEKDLHTMLRQFGKIFKIARLKVNRSCGLHVHIDMRRRDLVKCYEKLKKFEDALFAMVSEDRWGNEYCKRRPLAANDRHTAINKRAYDRHRTLEIRLHHGSLEVDKIEKWIRLLLNVINSKMMPTITNKKDVLRWRELDRNLRSYVKREFKDEWFDEKDRLEF